MLIVGDYASNKHISYSKPDILEIFYESDEKDNILNRLNLKDTPNYVNNGLEYYYNDRKIRLFNIDKNPVIKRIYQKSSSIKNNPRLASLFLNYAIYKAKIKFRSKNIREWENNFIKYIQYKEQLIKNGNKDIVKDAITTHYTLVYYNYIQKDTIPTSYQYNQYLVYDKFELYSLLSENMNSPSEQLIKNVKTLELDYNVWKKFNYNKKLDSVLEILYVDNAIEYLIPQIEINKVAPRDGFQYFIYCIMNLMTSPNYPDWIKHFIENNYFDIINNYRGEYIENLIQLIKHNVLKTVNND